MVVRKESGECTKRQLKQLIYLLFSLKQVEVEVSNQIPLSANVQSTPFSNTEKD